MGSSDDETKIASRVSNLIIDFKKKMFELSIELMKKTEESKYSPDPLNYQRALATIATHEFCSKLGKLWADSVIIALESVKKQQKIEKGKDLVEKTLLENSPNSKKVWN